MLHEVSILWVPDYPTEIPAPAAGPRPSRPSLVPTVAAAPVLARAS